MNLTPSALATVVQNGTTYFANDLYRDTTYSLSFVGGSATLAFRLKPYGSAVFVLSDSIKRLTLPSLVPIPVSADRPEVVSASEPSFQLHQNYPNPFSAGAASAAGGTPSTTISYRVPKAAYVSLKVYNVLGEEIAVLGDQWQDRGDYAVRWNGLGQDGRLCASGVYFVRMEAGGLSLVKKLVLVR